VDEVPDGPVIHFQTTFGKLGHQYAQGEVSFLDPLQEPRPVPARDQFWPVAAHLAGRNATGLAQEPHAVLVAAERELEWEGKKKAA